MLHRPGMPVLQSCKQAPYFGTQCVSRVRAFWQHGKKTLHKKIGRDLLLRYSSKGFDPREEQGRPAGTGVPDEPGKIPRKAFISTDWASSSRLWPVAIAVAPAVRAASVSAFLRRMPQMVQASVSRPASRVSRSAPTRSRKETMRWSTPSRPVRASAARMVSVRYPAIPSSTVMATRSAPGHAGRSRERMTRSAVPVLSPA